MRFLTEDETRALVCNLKAHEVSFATTSLPDYEETRVILVERDYGAEYVVIVGSHCSCYGFEDCEWIATLYTREELIKASISWTCGEEKELAEYVKRLA